MATMPCNINFRASIEEREAFENIAEKLGITRSRLFRILLSCASKGVLTPDEILEAEARRALVIDTKTWARILTESRRWGNNYNQGVRALNRLAMRFEATGMTSATLRDSAEHIAIAEENFLKCKTGIDRVANAAEDAISNSLRAA